MKSDEEKLRELFEIKEEPTFNNTVKKAKTVSMIRTITVSLMIFIVVSFILLISNSTILALMSNKQEDNLRNWFYVAMPNSYMGSTQVDSGIMVGSLEYERYRFLENKPITDGSYKEGYTYMPFLDF